jgi:Sulfotransferase domain
LNGTDARKVFGIGLSKTGTTSLNAALEVLGFRAIHYPVLDRIHTILDAYDAATDTPVACSFKELDKRYPGSKFVLTVRNTTSWLRSCEFEFKGRLLREDWKRDVRLRTYGVLEWEPLKFRDAYAQHVQQVHAYFEERPAALLIMDITVGDGWELLCPFLGRAVPSVPFPRLNVTEYRRSLWRR